MGKQKPSQKTTQAVFASAPDWPNNACLNFCEDPMLLYIMGYKMAADSLVEHVKSTRQYQDALIYPVVFLYRQYLELRLKDIIHQGRKLFDEGQGFPTHHRLCDLWASARQTAIKAFPDGDNAALLPVDNVVKEMEANDPKGMAFRYPKDLDGGRHIPNIKYINLRHLKECMEETSCILEGIACNLSLAQDVKDEMRSAYEC